MSEANKALARKFNEEIWNKGNLDMVDELCAANFVDHSLPPGMPNDREGLKQFTRMYLSAFSGMKMVTEDVIAEGDRVVGRWSATGTHSGELMGIAPTNKKIKVTGIAINKIENGKFVESWSEFDLAGMLMQLGVVPPLG